MIKNGVEIINLIRIINMKKQFVPYSLALKLKELSFDEECFGYWESPMDLEYNPLNNPEDFNAFNQKECAIYAGGILAPLYQQAFDWFRLRFNLDSYIKSVGIYGYYFYIGETEFGDVLENCGWHYEVARLKCIEQLIKIAEENK